MKIGILLPGFSSHPADWAIPVQQNLARALGTSDDLRVIALRYPHRRDHYAIDGAEVYSLGAGQARGASRLRLWWAALRVVEALHREKPFDVLHAMWADETGLIASWAGRRIGVPVVVSVLGGELVGLRDIGYGLQRSAFSRWIVRQALSGADRVVVPGDYIRRLAHRFDVPKGKLTSIALGVDTGRFSPSTTPPIPKRLIHVASLVPVKDQPTLLRAFALLDETVTLDIIGEGWERANLETLAASLGIASRVRFLGAVAHPDLPGYYQQAALHVLTSRHEAGALSPIEAAACGVPTVSTAVGIVPDTPSLGITVPVGDVQALADTIRSLLDDPPRLSALRQSARQTATTTLSIQSTAASLRALYTELTGKP